MATQIVVVVMEPLTDLSRVFEIWDVDDSANRDELFKHLLK